MTSPVHTSREDEAVTQAARRMRDANVGFLPVCDASGRIVGAVTDRDIAIRACAEDFHAFTVGTIMSPDILSCRPQDRIELAEALMRERHASRILVTDEQGRALGVISLADIAQYDEAGAGRTLREVSEREARPREIEAERGRGVKRWGAHLAGLRRTMVEGLVHRGIGDRTVLRAMLAVPREAFMPPELALQAYDDRALALGDGRSIASPYATALMAAALHPGPGDRLLEIGTGSGYATVILACLAGKVITVAGQADVADEAGRRLRGLGVGNVSVVTDRIPEGVYEAIAVHGAAGSLPEPLLEQLAIGGRLVVSTEGPAGVTRMVCITRTGESTFRRDMLGNGAPASRPPTRSAEKAGPPPVPTLRH